MRLPRRPRRLRRLRALGRRVQPPSVPPMIRRALAHAHEALQSGSPGEAAHIYARLADEAYARARLRGGVQMDLEATRAYVAAGDHDQAQARALKALAQLLEAGHLPHRVGTVVARIEAALEESGADSEARSFHKKVEDLLAAHGHSWDQLVQAPDVRLHSRRRSSLPAQCPKCYAPLRSDEVDWLEPDRAQCSYCGAVVVAE